MDLPKLKITGADWDTNLGVHDTSTPKDWGKIGKKRASALRDWLGPSVSGMVPCSRCHNQLCMYSGCDCSAPHDRLLLDAGLSVDIVRRFLFCPPCAANIMGKITALKKVTVSDEKCCELCNAPEHTSYGRELETVKLSDRPGVVDTTIKMCSDCYSEIHHVIYDMEIVATAGEGGFCPRSKPNIIHRHIYVKVAGEAVMRHDAKKWPRGRPQANQ